MLRAVLGGPLGDAAAALQAASARPEHLRPGYAEPPPTVSTAYARGDWAALLPEVPEAELSHHAVLVALYEAEGEVRVLLTQRSSHLRAHGGEVSCPGGRRDDTDAAEAEERWLTVDAWTALRESHEEVGLPPHRVQLVCELERLAHPGRGGVFGLITPVVGLIDAAFVAEAEAVQNAEVSRAFTVPLEHFLGTGPGYTVEDAQLEHYMFRRHSWHYHPSPPAAPDPADESSLQPWLLEHGTRVWGMTARAQRNLVGLHPICPALCADTAPASIDRDPRPHRYDRLPPRAGARLDPPLVALP